MEERKKKPTSPVGPNGECCATCRFYVGLEGQSIDKQEYNDCREASPVLYVPNTITVHTSGETRAVHKVLSTWPRSHRNDWCGKYERKI
jgi:hypothetical protein